VAKNAVVERACTAFRTLGGTNPWPLWGAQIGRGRGPFGASFGGGIPTGLARWPPEAFPHPPAPPRAGRQKV